MRRGRESEREGRRRRAAPLHARCLLLLLLLLLLPPTHPPTLGSKNRGTCVWEKAMYAKKGLEPGAACDAMKSLR